MQFAQPLSISAMLVTGGNIDESLIKWHQRLGHFNYQDVKRMFPDLKRASEPFCADCVQNKMARPKFGKAKEKTQDPLARLHVDMCGPMRTRGMDGERFTAIRCDGGREFINHVMIEYCSKASTWIKRSHIHRNRMGLRNAKIVQLLKCRAVYCIRQISQLNSGQMQL